MEILDIHTHRQPLTTSEAIINCTPQDFSPREGYYYSVGYHPWYLSKDESGDWNLPEEIASHPQVLAIGEAGLDKIRGAEFSLQERAFEKQARTAQNCKKPLIIHSVRTYNEIIRFKQTMKPDNPWIIHGFRGKKELANQLLEHGLYLSFGENYRESALQSMPLDRLFLETDESKTDIHILYEKAASLLSLPVDGLIYRIQQNISNVFFKWKSCIFE